METKGVTCKIPMELHNRISEEIRETESTMSSFFSIMWRTVASWPASGSKRKMKSPCC